MGLIYHRPTGENFSFLRCIPFLINNKEREGKSVSNMWGMNAQWSWEFSFRVHRIPLRDHCNPTELNNNPAVDKKCLLLHLPYFRSFVKLYKVLRFISMFCHLFQLSENKKVDYQNVKPWQRQTRIFNLIETNASFV